MIKTNNKWEIVLDRKPDFDKSLERIYSWLEHEIIDRPPIRFISNNQIYKEIQEEMKVGPGQKWDTYKERWYDTEFRVEHFIKCLEGEVVVGENFPIFQPDFSPNFLAGLYGVDLKFGEITAWSGKPILKNYSELEKLNINVKDRKSNLLKKAEELIDYALNRSKGKFLVGYPDIL